MQTLPLEQQTCIAKAPASLALHTRANLYQVSIPQHQRPALSSNLQACISSRLLQHPIQSLPSLRACQSDQPGSTHPPQCELQRLCSR